MFTYITFCCYAIGSGSRSHQLSSKGCSVMITNGRHKYIISRSPLFNINLSNVDICVYYGYMYQSMSFQVICDTWIDTCIHTKMNTSLICVLDWTLHSSCITYDLEWHGLIHVSIIYTYVDIGHLVIWWWM